MNIFFRVDASDRIGTGHVMRCLTLAKELARHGARISFICRSFYSNMCEKLQSEGCTVHCLPCTLDIRNSHDETRSEYADWLGSSWQVDAEQTAAILKRESSQVDWLIVDHYAIDYKWEKSLRPYVNKIMIIDDLADRRHECDLLLDQNFNQEMLLRYKEYVDTKCVTLLGPAYALLRPMFAEERKRAKIVGSKIRRIHVFFGGVDLTNLTAKSLEAIRQLSYKDIYVDVIVGKTNPYKNQIEGICSKNPNIKFYCQVESIAKLMAKADLALGAAGTTTWERCCLGLGTLLISVAKNQVNIAKAADRAGIAKYLGDSKEISTEDIKKNLEYTILNPWILKRMRKNAIRLVDGQGVSRVISVMKNFDHGG
jgi:UDP-2,4-diacetamido-2,4,6-trideoxy-beta-L-altropyranose hydrolase